MRRDNDSSGKEPTGILRCVSWGGVCFYDVEEEDDAEWEENKDGEAEEVNEKQGECEDFYEET